jgi:membrane-associated protein
MLHSLLNPAYVLELFGYVGLGAIVFAESGLLVGLFLPGDTLLIAAGILASQGHLNILGVLLVTIVAAIVGDSVGYAFGKKIGPRLFTRSNSRWFSQDRITEAHRFFEKYGAQSIILARFVPVARTFVPVIAGTSALSYKKFVAYNVIGGLLWAIIVILLGYTLGRVIPNIDTYILPTVIVVSVVSLLPAIMHLRNHRTRKEQE